MELEKIVIDRWANRNETYVRRDLLTGFLRVSITKKEFGFEVKYFVAQGCFLYYTFNSLAECIIFSDKKLIENKFNIKKPFILC